MESLGSFPDGEWDFVSRLLFADDDFSMQNLFPNHGNDCWFSDEANANIGLIDESLFYSSDNLTSSSSFILPSLTQETYNLCDSSPISITNNVDSSVPVLSDEPELTTFHSESLIVPKLDGNSKKRSRVSSANVRRSRKKVESKKEETSEIYNSSEDDSNAFQEPGGIENSDKKVDAALNLTGKVRAKKASAMDSQSLYARKRREKINERLKVLQNLIPNGTKVDISTMLEEAVHYVKFLQLQIKLLSSDDLWMYSPIAYNGMDISLLRTISPTL